MGSIISRALLMIFGYAYPAYECYKEVEKNKPEIEQLMFWCQYWILVALLTFWERVGDALMSWLPMYSEVKLAFFIYLWCSKTKGTSYVYNSILRPFVAKYETDIDRNVLKLSVKAREIGVFFWQNAASYGQTKVYAILQYISSQSASQPDFGQTRQKQSNQLPLNSSDTSANLQQHDASEEEAGLSTSPSSQHIATRSNKNVISVQSVTETTTRLETMPVEAVSFSEDGSLNPSNSKQDTHAKEATTPTRGKWWRRRHSKTS